MAATALMGIVGFITCAFATWFLFQHRSEFAVRTLRGAVIPQLEQGRLDPATKAAVIDEIDQFASDIERGKYDNAEAAKVMSNLVTLPLDGWGDLQAIESAIRHDEATDYVDALKQFSRLKRATELGTANAMDFQNVLEPVRIVDSSKSTGTRLKQPLTERDITEVATRASLVADRAEIPDQHFTDIRLEAIIAREINAGR